MLNLLVSGNGTWWEEPPFSMSYDRFKEYSDAIADDMDAARPETLRLLEEAPTLLMYEVGAGGPHARTVRHGRVRSIVRRGRELHFEFKPDPDHAFMDRQSVLNFAEQLRIEPFEQHRTHWAIKDVVLPPELLITARAERIARPLRVVAAEYVQARRERRTREAGELAEELETFPASLEKALLTLPARITSTTTPITPELYPIIGIEPHTAEGRNALVAVLSRDDANLPDDWFFSLAWFLDRYGSRTEAPRLQTALERCAAHMVELGRSRLEDADVGSMAYTLWRVAQSSLLRGQLRRETAVLVDRLIRCRDQGSFWTVEADGQRTASVRVTALAIVSLQRLGDDRFHSTIRNAVEWLVAHRLPDIGAVPGLEGSPDPDLVATALFLEAVRRSDLADDVPHILEDGDAWLITNQTEQGGWNSEPWSPNFVTAVVLNYLTRRSEMLAQVDGFLLMARDFFRKAEELRLEGGANNRRLAAISTVHAVEMFLYGVFERREDLALSAYKENGVETLGPREALRALQDALQRLGTLVAPQRLAHRDQLSSLIGRRDGIIHRAHEISEVELNHGIEQARSFIIRYGKELLSLDLLQ